MDLTQLRPRAASVSVTVNDPGYRPATITGVVELRPPMLPGFTTAPTSTRKAAADFPGIAYFREFGTDGPDADSLPELPPHNATKLDALPNAVAHVSWKDDVDQLPGWLDDLTRPIYLTWYHEPMGDVVPATYRATAGRVTQMVNAHRNRRLVLGHGPIVTRYWLDEKNGDPLDWAYPGMTHYGVDAYSQDRTAYWSASRMFGSAFTKIRTRCPGVRLLVPEYGMPRTTTDSTGEGRAAAIREHLAHLAEQPDVDAVAYWSNLYGTVDYRINPGTPEAAALLDAFAPFA